MGTMPNLLSSEMAVQSFDESVRLAGAMWKTLTFQDRATVDEGYSQLESGLDVGVFVVYTLACFFFNWGVRWIFVEPLGRVLLRRPNGSPPPKKSLEKFAQSAMEVVMYGLFAVAGVILVLAQDFSWPSRLWWDYKRYGPVRDDIRMFYILYAGRYFQAAISVLMEHRRKDFVEMQIHHWVTVLLVGVSYVYDYRRVGIIVMMLLDPADVPLHVAKCCKYISESGGSKRWFQWCADRCFEVFAVVFFITRLVMYPYLCWSASFEYKRYSTLMMESYVCIILLDILLALQVYWMYLIVRVAVRMWKHGQVEDVRSDDEDEGETEKKKQD